MNSEKKNSLRVRELSEIQDSVGTCKVFEPKEEPMMPVHEVEDSPPSSLTGQKRKSSTTTEIEKMSSPEKIKKPLEYDQIIDISDASSNNSTIAATIIYDFNKDSGIDSSIFDKSTEIVLPEKENCDQCSTSNNENEADISRIIPFSDVPLSAALKCLNWIITAPVPVKDFSNFVEETTEKSAEKIVLPEITEKFAEKQKDSDQKTKILESSDADNLLNKSTKHLDQQEKFIKEPKPEEIPKITAKTQKISNNDLIIEKNSERQSNPTKIVKLINELFEKFKCVKSLKRLLSPEEKQILHKFEKMNENQQFIVIKLYTRKKIWYNVMKFCEIINIEYTKDFKENIRNLCKQGFVEYFNPDPEKIQENLNQLEIAKIKKLITDLNISSKDKTKKHMIESILKKCNTQKTLTKNKTFKDIVMEKITKLFGKVIRIKAEIIKAFDNFCLLAIFTNSTIENIQDYLRYHDTILPEAPLQDFPIFYTREKFLEYADAIELKKKLENILVTSSSDQKVASINQIANQAFNCLINLKTDEDDHVNDPHLNRYTAAHVYRKLLSYCCEKLFAKKKEFSLQVKLWLEFLIEKFPSSKKLGKWYFTLIGLHMRHLETISYETAAVLLIEVLSKKASYLGEKIKYELEVLGNSLKNNKSHQLHQNYKNQLTKLIPNLIDITSIPLKRFNSQAIPSNSSGRKKMYTFKCDDEVTILNVETLALLEYKKDGYFAGDHSEGSQLHQLLMLYFWDIFYNSEEIVECTFISQLQNAPLDIFSEYFYEKRKEPIDKRLKEIEHEWSSEELLKFAIDNFEEHSHEYAVFGQINSVLDKEIIEDLVEVIGRKILAKIFQRLVKNLGEMKSGMPDLLVWNPNTKTHKFVEVKGKNDRLAAHQILWLIYLQEIGANVEICYVDSIN